VGDTAWKEHERIVARYFGVERGKRGDDFGQVGCEVVAPLLAWRDAAKIANAVKLPRKGEYAGVIVECKQGYSKLPVTMFRDVHKNNPNKDGLITLMNWGPYLMSWMQDRDGVRVFDLAWNDLIAGRMTAVSFLRGYYMETVRRQVPKYLDDFMEQSEDYGPAGEEQLGGKVKPLVALHAKGMQGRLIVWRF